MTNNEFLKALWEGMPGKWVRQVWDDSENDWFDTCPEDCWVTYSGYRLVPVVPEGCEPPPEDAYAYGPDQPGAVCLQGPVNRPKSVERFLGWAYGTDLEIWFDLDGAASGLNERPYLLDLKDPNAAEILALNRPAWELPETGPTPEQRAALDELVAERQESGEYDTPDPSPDLVIPSDVMENCDIEDLIRGALACGYSIKMVDGIIVGWRDE